MTDELQGPWAISQELGSEAQCICTGWSWVEFWMDFNAYVPMFLKPNVLWWSASCFIKSCGYYADKLILCGFIYQLKFFFLMTTDDCFIYILDKYVVQILVQSHLEIVSLVLVLEATEPVSKPVTQMALELINNYLISVP